MRCDETGTMWAAKVSANLTPADQQRVGQELRGLVAVLGQPDFIQMHKCICMPTKVAIIMECAPNLSPLAHGRMSIVRGAPLLEWHTAELRRSSAA